MATLARLSRKALASFLPSSGHHQLISRTLATEAASVAKITGSSDRIKWDYRGQRQIIPLGQWLPKIAVDAYVAPNVVLAGQVNVCDGSSVWDGSVLRGDLNKITVGFCSNVQEKCVVHAAWSSPTAPARLGPLFVSLRRINRSTTREGVNAHMTSQIKFNFFHTFASRHLQSRSIHSPTTQNITTPTKKTCIHLLKTCKSMNELKQIQTQVFRLHLLSNEDAIKKLMAFTADPSIGNLSYAQKIFNCIKTPSLFVFNIMIKAYAKNGRFNEAISLFDQMRVQGLWPDNYTYPFVFKAIGCLREGLIGEKIHGFVVKCGDGFDCYVCNSVMDMYGQVGCVGSLKKVFDEMPQRDLVSWNVLLSGFVRCRKFEDAVGVYLRMREEGNVKPDEATLVSTLSACTALKNLKLGKEIHRYVVSEYEFTTIIDNSLLDMYSKCGCLDVARQIFDYMPRKNVICWTSIVSGYVNCGQLEEARVLFDRSPLKDIVLWTAMINGYVQFNRVDDALALFCQMQIEGIKPDKFTVVSLLTGCAQLGALKQGKWIHEYIEENHIHIDAFTGTALIEMYAKCGCIDKSMEIFYELNEKDTASWTSIICALSMNGKTSKALELYSAMKRAGFKPDDITFIGVLNACSHGGLVEEGRMHFESIKKVYGIEAKVEHYGCLIDLLGRAGQLSEAEELIDKIQNDNNQIIISLYGALLSACRIYGDVDMGERLAKRFMEMEENDSSVHTLLANIYASTGRWEEVIKVRKKMRALGVKKEPGCSSIEVNGNVHEFIVGDASHPKMNEVYSILKSMLEPLSGYEENEVKNLM